MRNVFSATSWNKISFVLYFILFQITFTLKKKQCFYGLVHYNNPDWDLSRLQEKNIKASHIYVVERHYSKIARLTYIACMFWFLLRWSTRFHNCLNYWESADILSSVKLTSNVCSFVKKISLTRFNWRLIQLSSANESQDTQEDKHQYYCCR